MQSSRCSTQSRALTGMRTRTCTRTELALQHAQLSDRLIFRDGLSLLRNVAGFAALGSEGSSGIGGAISKQVRNTWLYT